MLLISIQRFISLWGDRPNFRLGMGAKNLNSGHMSKGKNGALNSDQLQLELRVLAVF